MDSLVRFGPEGEGDGARVPELLPVPQVLFGRRPDLLVLLLLRRSKRCQERRGGAYVSGRTAGLAALHAVLADHVASGHTSSSMMITAHPRSMSRIGLARRASGDKTVACWCLIVSRCLGGNVMIHSAQPRQIQIVGNIRCVIRTVPGTVPGQLRLL